jgi:hypothetical protein
MKEEVVVETGATAPSWVKRVSWGAIFAGLFVTIVIQIMLTLLGVAVGLATVHPTQEQEPARGLALGSAIWLVVSGLISIWLGGCVAGRLSGGPRRADGMLHGIVTWSVSTVAMLALMATSLGAALGGIGSLLSNAVGNTEQGSDSGLASLSQGVKELKDNLQPTGRTDNDNQENSLTSMAAKDPKLGAAVARMETQRTPEARERVTSILTAQHGMDQAQAEQLVNQWDQQIQQTKAQAGQKAREFGETAARGISKGALWGFIAMFLGLLAAAWGGWSGVASLPRRVAAVATAVT